MEETTEQETTEQETDIKSVHRSTKLIGKFDSANNSWKFREIRDTGRLR